MLKFFLFVFSLTKSLIKKHLQNFTLFYFKVILNFIRLFSEIFEICFHFLYAFSFKTNGNN